MSERCPHCGHAMPRSRITADDLRRWCVEQGHFTTVDDAVYESVAALILDRSPGTVANWRANGGAAVPWFRSGRTGRVRYRLSDLADYLEAQRCEA